MNVLHYLKSEKVISIVIVLGLILTVISIPIFLWNETLFDTSLKINSEKFGHIGDFIGGFMGSMWALAGVFLFYKALTEQRTDFSNNKKALELQVEVLKEQIKEFELSREEQKLSRRVYEEQSKTAKIQQFDTSFYSLLSVYLNIKNNLNSIEPDYFSSLVFEVSKCYDNTQIDPVAQKRYLVSCYIEIYNKKREALSRYFRSLYRILSVIDSTPNLTEKEKFQYTKVVRAQLSDYELIVLSYNSYTFLGLKTQQLILKYNLLKHLPVLNLPALSEFQKSQENSNLIILVDVFNRFLRKNLPSFYDVTNETPKVEEEFKELNVILGIYFNEEIQIKIYTDLNIKNSKIHLSDDEFAKFIFNLSYEMLVFQNYLLEKEILIEKSKIEFDDKKAFCLSINTGELLTLNEDKF